MENKQLVIMANQIASFFMAYPDENEGIHGVANHIEKFWSPKMRKQLMEIINNNDSQTEILEYVLKASKHF
jgi:formate dehydrogenase subunit delta